MLLFWTSCVLPHGFQSQSGYLARTLSCLRAVILKVTSGATPAFSTNRGVHCISVYNISFKIFSFRIVKRKSLSRKLEVLPNSKENEVAQRWIPQAGILSLKLVTILFASKNVSKRNLTPVVLLLQKYLNMVCKRNGHGMPNKVMRLF